jgi:hypothetical protein
MIRQPKYSKEEHSRMGSEIYERNIRAHVEGDHKSEFAAIDVDTGEYEVDHDELTACNTLLARLPEAQIWLERIDYPYVRRFGPRCLAGTK